MSVAKLIPDEERKEILQKNIIANATISSDNPEMNHLMAVWRTYIEPGIKPNCPLCYQRVLDNFRALQPILVKLEYESNLLG